MYTKKIENEKIVDAKMEQYKVIGVQCWFNINVSITNNVLKEIFNTVGLSDEYIPSVDNVESFMKAIKKQVKDNDIYIKKIKGEYNKITCEVLQNHGEKLGHIIYNKKDNSIEYKIDTQYVEIFKDHYDLFQVKYDSDTVERILTKIITNTLHGVVIPKNNIYFVLKEHIHNIEKIKQAVNKISDKSSFEYIGVLDSNNEREVWNRCLVYQLNNKIENWKKDIETLKSKKIKEEVLKERNKELRLLKDIIETYKKILNFDLIEVEEKIAEIEKVVNGCDLRLKKISELENIVKICKDAVKSNLSNIDESISYLEEIVGNLKK